ncbi:lef-5 [Antheraea pernyi nucleopolyhedrovirus]|uniref:Late expression factor 5 n=2 Tax=Antheraea pernyi nuclear polyhedrosis virus TaxID=161494 RepID=Q7T5F9_NPVAP|nr:lef-5 [Antheraea pernyi nucleopolyhedrovirus]AWD33577.1 late expression factor 5 [Antheraea proylei nucleopolyhedrovirus]BBD50513.1 late expression factor 5 [Antheraea yamamai nucleopolyhedrovirus]BBD50665.1 late expression factor 5 [Samia cynthia nucleopolyhedrovirus]ABF50294.1 lef-5 [Antheraea pernyi nucleopolyhedrovirus]ABQ12285.1 late expression factor 5 [Antheraea pernyi nucleopolyhedrovirus]
MAAVKGVAQPQTRPLALHGGQWTPRALFTVFAEFRASKDYAQLIRFLTTNFACYVKNKTFNFANTGHLFHSLYAYVPNVSELVKERKQIRLQVDCVTRLLSSTTNDFKMYVELFEHVDAAVDCPCLLLQRSMANAKNYVDGLNCKRFDIKPPKFKKEPFDAILCKYSLNYKSLLLKRKEKRTVSASKRQKKIKRRQLLNDKVIYLVDKKRFEDCALLRPSGLSLKPCRHKFVVAENQTRAGDEMVSFIQYCERCRMRVN